MSELRENIQDFLTEKKKPVLVSCILIVFFFAALILIVFTSNKKSSNPIEFRSEPLVSDQPLLLPQGLSVPSGYAVGRVKKEKWSVAEVEQWRTKINSDSIEKLAAANEKMVEAVTEAAP